MRTQGMRAALCVAVAAAGSVGVTARAHAQSPMERLQVHGFLTQGLGKSSSEPVMGLGKDATSDYRSAALQVRYQVGSSDDVVIQLSHNRVGSSLLNDITPEVEMDWAFWQHRFGSISTRIGKVPMPRGLYNEIRDVGTLLPFYRAPVNVYSEGYETIDGVVVAHSMDLGRWGLGTELYAGSWKGIELDFDGEGEEGYEAELEEMRRTLATQLWVQTPVSGLRFGLAAARWVEVDLDDDDPPQNESFVLASVDGTFDRAMVRSELRQGFGSDDERRDLYGQVGYRILPAIAINFQGEYSTRLQDPLEVEDEDEGEGEEDEEESESTAPSGPRYRFAQDFAVGINYHVGHNIVFKLEGHMAKGYGFERFIDTRGPAARTRYVISSFAVSF